MPNVNTPEAILSYVTLFTPKQVEKTRGDKKVMVEEYSCSFVFPDASPKTLMFTDPRTGEQVSLLELVLTTAKERWGDKLKGGQIKVLETQHGPANFLVAGDLRIRLPWRDNPDDVSSKGYPEGSLFINTRTENVPGVVSTIPAGDPNNPKKPAIIVSDAGDIRLADGTTVPKARPVYSGCIGRGLVSIYSYDVSGSRGVTVGLSGVQVIRDGERLDGRAKAEDSFEADMDAVPDLGDLTGTTEPEAEPETAGATAETGGDDISDLLG